jgi:hypothetical protein
MSSTGTSTTRTDQSYYRRLDQAATKATELVQTFATVDDPYSTDEENPWKHPDRIFQALRAARDDLLQAWKELETQQQLEQQQQANNTDGGGGGDGDSQKPLDPEHCRALYMDMITDAFADTLENMRNTEGSSSQLNVDVLVDCLQSGMDLLTNEEQAALFFSQALDHEFDQEDEAEAEDEDETGDTSMMADKEKETKNDETLTPHERHRRKMGLDVPVSG